MNEETNALLDHCRNYAMDLLLETGELFPFGALTDAGGRTHHREVEVDPKHAPSNGEIMESLLKYFQEEFDGQGARAYALAYEASVQLDKDNQTDVIAVDIRHRDATDIPVYYFPFTISVDKNVEFGEAFAVARKSNHSDIP